jgi:phosphoserine aminotransferase
MTHRIINFSAGPATLPLVALETAQKEMLDFQGTGMSLMEHSHRGKTYEAVHAKTKALVKELFGVPDTHEVLFMQGGASAQFGLIPMNFLGKEDVGSYVNTGVWSKKAIGEAKIVAKAQEAATSAPNFTRVPKQSEWKVDPAAKYVHITTNNTIYGTQYHYTPDTGAMPLIADTSSDMGWRPMDVSKFALIYAGAQKNLGPAGVTLVIVKKDFVETGRKDIPTIFQYRTVLEGDSLHNTVPTFPVYMVGLVLEWVKNEGGLPAMEKRNQKKAEILYGAIDANADYYRCPVEKESRSVMNVVFRLPTEELENKFVSESNKAGFSGLKGHRSAGGIRVSMYNATSPADIEKLVGFMDSFAKNNK